MSTSVQTSNRSLIANLRLLGRYKQMLLHWTSRELKGRYRQSILGPAWALIQPVFQIIVISTVFGSFMNVSSEGFPYPVFAYVALLPWLLFSGSVGAAVPSLVSNMNLLSKIYFPREILPLSAILNRFVDFLIASVVFVGLMWWYNMPVHPTIAYVPLLLFVQTCFALGFSLFGATISVFVRDVSYGLPYLMQLWMYLSPVLYSVNVVPEKWRGIYFLNPMAVILDSYRQVLLWGRPPNLPYLALATVISVGFCLGSYVFFKKLEKTIPDVL